MSTLQSLATSSSLPVAANTPTTIAGAAAAANAKTKSDFMTMLVAQMKYQDPTKPVDSAQMTSQLAQLSTVDGINTMNTNMNSLISNSQSSMAFQASALIGHTVVVAGNNVALNGGQGAMNIQLPASADAMSVTIMDANNQPLKVINLGPQAAGTVPVNWDGTNSAGTAVAAGNYTYMVNATSKGQAVAATGTSTAQVSSVSQAATGLTLNLSNNSTAPASSVLQIL